MTNNIGKKIWVIPGGNIPLDSHGVEPAFTSHDKISVLNSNIADAHLELNIYFEFQEPLGPYVITVKSKRVCKVRFNDLIDPMPIMLNKPFACVITSDTPVVIQFSRMNTSSSQNAIAGTIAFYAG